MASIFKNWRRLASRATAPGKKKQNAGGFEKGPSLCAMQEGEGKFTYRIIVGNDDFIVRNRRCDLVYAFNAMGEKGKR